MKMKKAYFILIFLTLFSWVYPAEVKIMGGISLSKSTKPVQGAVFDYYYKPVFGEGAIFGAGLEFDLTQRTAIEVDALYFQKGSRIEIIYGDIVVDRFLARLGELSFPVIFKYYFWPETSPYVLGGGELAIVLAKDPKWIDYGLVVGIGFRKRVHNTSISFEGRYHHGLQDTFSGSWGLRKMRALTFLARFSL